SYDRSDRCPLHRVDAHRATAWTLSRGGFLQRRRRRVRGGAAAHREWATSCTACAARHLCAKGRDSPAVGRPIGGNETPQVESAATAGARLLFGTAFAESRPTAAVAHGWRGAPLGALELPAAALCPS